MMFNTSKLFDFPPEFSFSNGDILDVVESHRLLGVIISSELRWQMNTNEIFKKCLKKMWLLRRMKASKLEPDIIIEFYLKEIRILAEHGVIIWNGGLTLAQSNTLEKVQKIALKIILGDNYISYDNARSTFGLPLLSERRTELCINFAVKLYNSKYCTTFFSLAKGAVSTRQRKPLVEGICNTKKNYNAPHNYLSRLLNQNSDRLKILFFL